MRVIMKKPEWLVVDWKYKPPKRDFYQIFSDVSEA